MIKKTFLPVLLATIWISISEFVRNEFLLKAYWTDHYESMGLVFPSEPINGAVLGNLVIVLCHWHLYYLSKILIGSNHAHILVRGFRSYVACDRQYERTAIWNTTICHSVKHPGSIWGCIHHHENDEQVKMNEIIVIKNDRIDNKI
jgi:hypothetical protein